ncbi:MAG: triose-phosphate isomerase [Alphaproteobacteria bacterium]|nr:MAG: triose-phosphate isomerase [Alphaproteobacteria bacterium]
MNSTAPKPLVAGNWKMNGLRAAASVLDDLAARLAKAPAACEVMVCPPATLLHAFAQHAKGTKLTIGAQDCHPKPSGAHTGDIAAEMLRDAGAVAVIVGHSERRADHGENDALVAAKATAAWRAGLTAIVCVGETESERDGGRTLDVVATQLARSVPEGATPTNTVIAYEPVWAIGTGRTPSVDDVAQVHGMIRARLRQRFGGAASAMRILYGGSVKPDNARTLLAVADVDGALVGGASLKAADFDAIIAAYR